MHLLYAKALHIIFVVTWFAGLFYIVRLFIYDVEAGFKPKIEADILKKQFRIMQRRLWYGITVPSMCLTILGGIIMLGLNYYQPDSKEVPNGKGIISKYARGRDYHKVIAKKTKKLISEIEKTLDRVAP